VKVIPETLRAHWI